MKKRSFVLAAVLALGGAAVGSADESVRVRFGAASADWQLASPGGKSSLTVVGPAGRESLESPAGVAPSISLFDRKGQLRPDGVYRWELVVAPQTAAERTEAGEGGGVPGGRIVSGTFAIRDGAFLTGEEVEPAPKLEAAPQAAKAGDADGGDGSNTLFTDNLYVQGSFCVGFDCVNNESMGFDTIRLKENSLRIKFDDTSTTAGFPNRDWQITANDSASGGANKFSIEDITGAKVPFTIEAGAPTNSLFVDDGGRLGVRTATPVLDFHIASGNTPALRLEQNTSSGFTAQTWDIAANETNFFVRDVTGGSRLPFRIRPGAPSSSLDISGTGKIGVGTASPAQKLHVRGTDGTTQYLVEEASAVSANRVLMSLTNFGPVSTELVNTEAGGTTWRMNNLVGGLAFNNLGNAGNEAFLSPTGTLTVLQTVVELSDRNRKHQIVPVDPHDILSRVGRLPVATWSFIDSDPTERHLGPMAQDFAALFGLGQNDTTISARDMAGVSLAAIQAVNEKVDAKDARMAALESQNQELAARLAALEAALAKLANQP
jgi:hypothetical protein